MMKFGLCLAPLLFLIWSCPAQQRNQEVFILVTGTAQDAGYPQVGCQKACCEAYWKGDRKKEFVSSIAVIDPHDQEYWLFDCSPDIVPQLEMINNYLHSDRFLYPSGIFLTHAHIGHYTGLMYFGKEAMDAKEIPVFTMPRMKNFLESSGPWDQLVKRKNISIIEMQAELPLKISERLEVIASAVPHRDEYSETVGFKIRGKSTSALFIPDIDKWDLWGKDIIEEIKLVDYAFLDGTFYSGSEIPGRDMSEIPHPFILESVHMFSGLDSETKKTVQFIHFNHTNPILDPGSIESTGLEELGFGIARQGNVYKLD